MTDKKTVPHDNPYEAPFLYGLTLTELTVMLQALAHYRKMSATKADMMEVAIDRAKREGAERKVVADMVSRQRLHKTDALMAGATAINLAYAVQLAEDALEEQSGKALEDRLSARKDDKEDRITEDEVRKARDEGVAAAQEYDDTDDEGEQSEQDSSPEAAPTDLKDMKPMGRA